MSGVDGGAIRVLVVDDDPEFAGMVGTHLERERDAIDVVVERRPRDALARAADGSVDCVVSDFRMPGMDGLELLERVREDRPDLPFVLFTGEGSEGVASEAIAAGVTDYLRKGKGTERYSLLANRITDAVARRRAETSYREIFDEATDGIVVHDPETGEIHDVNRRLCEMLGYDRAELLDMEVGDFSVDGEPYTQAAAERRIRAAAEDGPRAFEWANETKEGERVPVEVHLRRTTIGGRERVLATVRDVSERRDSERKLRALVENTSQAVYFKDRDGRYDLINEPGAEMFGATPEEVVGSRDGELFEPEDARRIQAVDRRIMEQGEGATYEREVTIDGEARVLRNDKFPYRSRSGEVLGVIGISEDVTDRVEREEELRRYETIVEATGDPVYRLDANGRFTYVNDSFEALTGYPADELRGRHVSVIMADGALERGETLVRELVRDDHRDRATFELAVVTADSDRVPAEIHVALLPFDDDEFAGTVGVVRDVTDRVEREEELQRQNERLEEFASVVSHDLRNPLNVATGRLELFRETGEEAHVEQVVEALGRMETIVDDVLALARGGRTVDDPEPVAARDVVAGAWAAVDTAGASLDRGLDATVRADPSRLQRLLENLFANAVDHGGPDANVRVGRLDDGFYVADDGPGVPASEREAVFESGYSTDAEGTGFGLAIVAELAEAHGWRVGLEESDGGGARFEFRGVEFVDESG